MDPNHLSALIQTEQTYWWHVAKREMVLDLLRRFAPPPGRLIEGGIGGGSTLLACRERGYQTIGFDLMPESVAHGRSIGLDDVRVQDLQAPWPVPEGGARAVLLLDVIEHLPDPVAALKQAALAIAPGGTVIVTVPAVPRLFGPWDEMLGHYRRYSPKLLREHTSEAGLKTKWASHWNAYALPPALVVRAIEKKRGARRSAEFPPVSPFVNATLKALGKAERAWTRIAPVPFGLSLVGAFGK